MPGTASQHWFSVRLFLHCMLKLSKSGQVLWGQHYNKATPTLRDTQDSWVDGIWTHKQTSAVVILRDQTEEYPLCWVQSNIPKWSSKLMLELGLNWPNDISSGQPIKPWVSWYNLGLDDTTFKRMNPDRYLIVPEPAGQHQSQWFSSPSCVKIFWKSSCASEPVVHKHQTLKIFT